MNVSSIAIIMGRGREEGGGRSRTWIQITDWQNARDRKCSVWLYYCLPIDNTPRQSRRISSLCFDLKIFQRPASLRQQHHGALVPPDFASLDPERLNWVTGPECWSLRHRLCRIEEIPVVEHFYLKCSRFSMLRIKVRMFAYRWLGCHTASVASLT